MNYLVGLLSKKGADVSAQLARMLAAASPTRADGYGVAARDGVAVVNSLPDLPLPRSEGGLGFKFIKAMPLDQPQPVAQHGYAMVFEGRMWSRSGPSDLQEAADLMGPNPADGIRGLIERGGGSFAVIAAEEGLLICGRDHIGAVPLYMGETEVLVGAASNRRMLWSVGIEPSIVPPGSLAEMTVGGIRICGVRRLSQPAVREMAPGEAVVTLDGLLSGAVEARCRSVSRASLGFSGGIDSTLLAYYTDRCGVRLDLVCVGLEGSSDFEAAEKAADALGLGLRMEEHPPSRAEEDLDHVLHAVEEADPMKVGVAIPLHWAASSAHRGGNRIFFSGNGGDELFGGYLRYVREYASSGEAVAGTLFRDVSEAHAVNYERDHKVCADAGVELRLPFADPGLVEFALALPLELRLPRDEGALRKPLLRSLGRRLGLPDEVVSRQKRAIQYSTGVGGELRRLARREGVPLQRILSERLGRLRRRYEAGNVGPAPHSRGEF